MPGWSHNTAYHDAVLRAVPRECGQVLDVGCGFGELARKLAPLCAEVVGIDASADCVRSACAAFPVPGNTHFVQGDVLSYPFADASSDMIVAIATLHHMPLAEALARFRTLLRPGGVLMVIGLYRVQSLGDMALAAAALPASRLLRLWHGEAKMEAPMREPAETLNEIRKAASLELPGSAVQRLFFFRYELRWTKPL